MLVDIIVPTREEGKTWMVLATQSNQPPDNKKVGRIFRDSLIPTDDASEQVLNNRLTFRLVEGVQEEIVDAVKVLIKGVSYRLLGSFTNTYELDGYGIAAFITKDHLVHPYLRKSHFLEKQANDSDIGSEFNIKTWPVIISLEEEEN